MTKVEFDWINVEESTISSRHLNVLDNASRFFKLIKSKDKHDLNELNELHDKIVSGSQNLLEPAALDRNLQTYFERVIVKSLDLLSQKSKFTMDPGSVFDSFGSKCLHKHRVDYNTTESNQTLIQEIRSRLALRDQEVEQIQKENEYKLQDARLKKKIIKYIFSKYGFDNSDGQLKEYDLFKDVYGDVPIPADEIKMVISSNLIFFCLPFGEKDFKPKFSAFDALTKNNQVRIETFFQKVKSFKQNQFAHFPVFGFIKGSMMNADLINGISRDIEVPTEIIEKEMSTMVTILPQEAVDKYLLHDIWGHSWQASMLDFEMHYQSIAKYSACFTEIKTKSNLALEDCFKDGLCSETLHRFLTSVVTEKLAHGTTPVLAELLADIMEYKFIEENPDLQHFMPNSSIFKSKPVKLDFLVTDLTFYFQQCTKSMRLWLVKPERRLETKSYLENKGISSPPIDEMAGLIKTFLSEMEPSIVYEESGERIEINLFTRVALNYLALHSAILSTYGSVRAHEKEINSFFVDGLVDLMVLSIAVYFEEDPVNNMWHLDEFLSYFFIPLTKKILC